MPIMFPLNNRRATLKILICALAFHHRHDPAGSLFHEYTCTFMNRKPLLAQNAEAF